MEASQCQINTSHFVLKSSALINGNCSLNGTIQAQFINIDSYSQFVLQNWWTVSAYQFCLYGVVYASAISFVVDQFKIYGGVNTDGRGFGPAQGPGAGGSDYGMLSLLNFNKLYNIHIL